MNREKFAEDMEVLCRNHGISLLHAMFLCEEDEKSRTLGFTHHEFELPELIHQGMADACMVEFVNFIELASIGVIGEKLE